MKLSKKLVNDYIELELNYMADMLTAKEVVKAQKKIRREFDIKVVMLLDTMSDMLLDKNITYDQVYQALEVLGYELV